VAAKHISVSSLTWVLVRDFFPEFFPLRLTAESRFFSVGVDVQCAELTPGILFPILSLSVFLPGNACKVRSRVNSCC
jgi:hypothetical protein